MWASFVPRETIDAPRSRHVLVSSGTKKLERLWWTEFETTTSWHAGSNQETCWLRCKLADRATVSQRTDAEILIHVQPQGAHAPRADEEHIEPEILPVASLPRPREPSKDEIEKHNLLHDPAMPWCDICIQSKSRHNFHRQARPKVLPVIQFDYAVAGTYQDNHISTSWSELT